MEVILLFLLSFHTISTFAFQSDSFTHCQASKTLAVLEVLPGGGWDNLRNVDMGRVMNFSYSGCQTTEDGLYYIPDEVSVIPQKETGIQSSSEIIKSWTEQKSVTSRSINAEASFLAVLNGKFSIENQKTKMALVRNSSHMARAEVRDFLYSVKTKPDFPLDARFAEQLKDIADAIENNQTQNAAYLSERMVVDYGTHVITSVDAGASLVEEDYFNSNDITTDAQQQSNIEAEAGLHLCRIFQFKVCKMNIDVKNLDESSSSEIIESNIKHYNIESHGGEPFYPGITLQKWQESIKNNLVAIDRSGVPLHHVVNHHTLPDLPRATVEKVSQSLEEAITRYYKVNTRPGCVDANSPNFKFQANLDDGSCAAKATNFSFGGVYQQCNPLSNDDGSADAGPLCDKLAQKNPDTGDFSCRSPYTPTLLRSEVRQEEYPVKKCHMEKTWYFAQKEVCETRRYNRSANIDTYWCSHDGTTPVDSLYLFGGFYSTDVANPITNVKSCPPNFISVKFLSEEMTLCLSHDYEEGLRYAMLFGGFFSCESPNPLANHQHQCPPEFSEHLVTVSKDCEISYCTASKSVKGEELKPVQLPPFTKPPEIRMAANGNVTIMTEGEKNWVREGEDKQWRKVKPEEVQEMLQKMDPDYRALLIERNTGVAFAVLAFVALVIIAAVLVVKRRGRGQASYHTFENESAGVNG